MIDSGANSESIAKWANDTYLNNIWQCSIKELEDFLSDLSIIDTPGFELEIPIIVDRSLDILRYELEQKKGNGSNSIKEMDIMKMNNCSKFYLKARGLLYQREAEIRLKPDGLITKTESEKIEAERILKANIPKRIHIRDV